MKKLLICLWCWFIPNLLVAGEAFRLELASLYNFSPQNLSSDQIAQKSKLLDQFWKKVKNSPNKYQSLLRTELSSRSHKPFFYYDGSKLLLSISEDRKDRELVLKAFLKTDLNDIQHTDYLFTVSMLAVEGYDTVDAALHILSYPNFKAFVAQHVLTLGQDYSLISMLMPLEVDRFFRKVLLRSKGEKDPVALKSLLTVLWYADKTEGLELIAKISNSSKYDEKIRTLAKNLSDDSNIKKSIPKQQLEKLYTSLNMSSDASYKKLMKTRKLRFNRISDEALIELDQITYLMKRARLFSN